MPYLDVCFAIAQKMIIIKLKEKNSPLFDVKSVTVLENDVENEMSGNWQISRWKMGFRKQDSTRRDPQGRDGVYPAWDTPIFQQEIANFAK